MGACAKAKARKPSIEWLWVDTFCIDKRNSQELTESLNSMFEWYKKAKVCYAYLYDVDLSTPGRRGFKTKEGEESEWFERGWTLQELLAPQDMEFYDQNWNYMGTKEELASELERVTGIKEEYLETSYNIQSASMATHMSWMAGRTTTRVEDIAYGVLGIFGISMAVQYGEGKQAFMRLQRGLMETSTNESIFAWTKLPMG